MARAVSCVEDLVNSVNAGTVTTATLKVLEKHSEQFLKLGEVHQTNENDPQRIPIETSFHQRLSELKEFHQLNFKLKCFLSLCSFTSGILEIFYFHATKTILNMKIITVLSEM